MTEKTWSRKMYEKRAAEREAERIRNPPPPPEPGEFEPLPGESEEDFQKRKQPEWDKEEADAEAFVAQMKIDDAARQARYEAERPAEEAYYEYLKYPLWKKLWYTFVLRK